MHQQARQACSNYKQQNTGINKFSAKSKRNSKIQQTQMMQSSSNTSTWQRTNAQKWQRVTNPTCAGWQRFGCCLFVHRVAAFASAPALTVLQHVQVLTVGVAYVLSVSVLSEKRLGCRCTSWRRLSNTWMTISAFLPGAVALQQSLALSAPVSIFKISLLEAVSWVWSYLYFALMVQWCVTTRKWIS